MTKKLIGVAALSAAVTCSAQTVKPAGENWYSYGGDAGGTHLSTLKQITKANVSQLKEAWQFVTPGAGSRRLRRSS